MGLDGMEVIAILVVIGLFVVVLKQFGIWEPLSLEGKTKKSKFGGIQSGFWFVQTFVFGVTAAYSMQSCQDFLPFVFVDRE